MTKSGKAAADALREAAEWCEAHPEIRVYLPLITVFAHDGESYTTAVLSLGDCAQWRNGNHMHWKAELPLGVSIGTCETLDRIGATDAA